MSGTDVCRLLPSLVGGPRPRVVAVCSTIISVVALVLAFYKHAVPVKTVESYQMPPTTFMTKHNGTHSLTKCQTHDGSQSHCHLDEPDQMSSWHSRMIDYADLVRIKAIQPGRLEVVQHRDFGTTPVLIKIGDSHEATMYRVLYGLGVTPLFLAHLTENSRTIGFVTEYVQPREEKPVPSPNGVTRKEACLAVLRRMHAHGIAHGDAHGENCLMREDGSAALIDFELSIETSSQAEFDRDLWIMSHTVDD